jgi:hypothetical protein
VPILHGFREAERVVAHFGRRRKRKGGTHGELEEDGDPGPAKPDPREGPGDGVRADEGARQLPQDAQFRYSLKREGKLLKYEKRLCWGGSIPHGPVGLALAIKDRSNGNPQEGEPVAAFDLTHAASVAIRKLQYAGYSAYRMPVAIFAGAAAVGLGSWLLPASFYEGWRFLISLVPVFLVTSFGVEWALDRRCAAMGVAAGRYRLSGMVG